MPNYSVFEGFFQLDEPAHDAVAHKRDMIDDPRRGLFCLEIAFVAAHFGHMLGETSHVFGNGHFVFIDDDNGTFRSVLEAHPECQYISGITAFDSFIEERKLKFISEPPYLVLNAIIAYLGIFLIKG